jgi:hypothetical protein
MVVSHCWGSRVVVVVVAVFFFLEVVGEVVVEVAVADEGAEFEDGFGAVEPPAGVSDDLQAHPGHCQKVKVAWS